MYAIFWVFKSLVREWFAFFAGVRDIQREEDLRTDAFSLHKWELVRT